VNRGEIWWVELSDKGRRPACILTRDAAIPVLRRVLIAPATTTIRGIPTEVELTLNDGMPKACVLSMDNVRVVPKAKLIAPITRLSPIRMNEICVALGAATDCQ
jgi:mRNA interferase MazF